jgi:23S rRNA (adenine2503-C2)-methyltransferase
MKILAEYSKEDLATVFVATMRDDNEHLVEFVESVQPPTPREEKWVLIVSSMFGCPVGCSMCDAGTEYKGKLQTDEILQQIDYMVRRRFPDGNVPVPKFKIQFARMGEPSLNPSVLDVLKKLPSTYNAPGLLPSLSTVGPKGTEKFFDRLIDIKNAHYSGGRFQLQFSIHSTDADRIREIIPVNTWDFGQIAEYGNRFHEDGDRKITLNFITISDYGMDFRKIREFFDPDIFLIKITPLNPTKKAMDKGLQSAIDAYDPSSADEIVKGFRDVGFDVILSIGEVEENSIGSNCGQYVSTFRDNNLSIRDGYKSAKYKV